MEQADWKLLDKQALGVIQPTLACNATFNIMNEKSTVCLMSALLNMNKKPFTINTVYLMHRLFHFKMDECALVADHINVLVSQLRSVKIDF